MPYHHSTYLALREARWGRPTQAKAVSTIAMFAVIPAVFAGIAFGVLFIEPQDSFGRLLTICSATAFGAAVVTLLSFKLLHTYVGFRAVARFANALIGTWVGGILGSALMFFAELGGWPLLLAPFGAMLGYCFGTLPSRIDADEGVHPLLLTDGRGRPVAGEDDRVVR